MAPPLLTLQDIHLSFGGTPLLEAAGVTVSPGDRICLVGRNGSGKSTLLRIAAGEIEPDGGERFIGPRASLRYLPQEADLSGFATSLDYVVAGIGPTDDPHIAQGLLNELGLSGDERPGQLSGGEARRAALAKVLAPRPDILLLDEPTNHLDIAAIEWLEERLSAMAAAILMISHDRRFLQNLSHSTLWLTNGRTRMLNRGFSAFESWRDEILEQEEIERHKLDRKIAREQQWLHGGVTARRKRNVRRVRELAELRRSQREARRAGGDVRLVAADAEMSGRLVVEALGIAKDFGGAPIVRDFSTRILRGDRVGLVGPNGAGKTTLARLLTGELRPDAGSVRLGTNLNVATIDQRREALNPDWTVSRALTGGGTDQAVINGSVRHITSYMKDFLFTAEQRNAPISALSGGERARLMLARVLAKPSNLLVLDEPTNDLDMETLDLMQELLADYPGTVILVSHDRDFLDRVVTSTIAPAGGGRWIEYAGGYSDMLAQRKGEAPAASDAKAPTRRSALARSARGLAPGKTPAEKAKRKLSFKEKHALETLPSEIAKLAEEIASLERTLTDPELFRADPSRFAKSTERLALAQKAYAAAEDRWLELELLREELAG
jgi:ABC transport system ATP-binding/permease protein